MLKNIYNCLPVVIKEMLRLIKERTIDAHRKKNDVKIVLEKQEVLLDSLQGKERIRVVFLVIHESVWKVDAVFKLMQQDPYFEPEILICPYTHYGEERMLVDMDKAYQYFKAMGYPVKKSQKLDGSWLKLSEIKPDIVFFTNPYKLTKDEYYENAYLNYLSCYVPYYYMVTKHTGNEYSQYNNLIFLLAWKLYWPHSICGYLHKSLSINKGVNGVVVGYPAVERLYSKSKNETGISCWKEQKGDMKKIIYAPHHSIENSKYSLSSFLKFGVYLQELSKTYSSKVAWSFKPHPILKSKLYLHPLWGKDKTDDYYEYWQREENTQLDESEYSDLFLESDAIIHDCSSFIVEYAFTEKPCLYLLNDNKLNGLLNDFGEEVMHVYKKAGDTSNIKDFVDEIVSGESSVDLNNTYFNRYVKEFYQGELPSQRIIEDLKQSIGILSDK